MATRYLMLFDSPSLVKAPTPFVSLCLDRRCPIVHKPGGASDGLGDACDVECWVQICRPTSFRSFTHQIEKPNLESGIMGGRRNQLNRTERALRKKRRLSALAATAGDHASSPGSVASTAASAAIIPATPITASSTPAPPATLSQPSDAAPVAGTSSFHVTGDTAPGNAQESTESPLHGATKACQATCATLKFKLRYLTYSIN
ncbi:hypothetical protein B0T22DRAFT_138485 [Podospora appendiculata]|uniref:Uncharacterized protein n=1 Tax=Podospora appendiculata TaxID=314037 RepID=A0AAE0X8H1_9PEZI|nr:hypothetical protein B0T22DRAFT_138485 [Podospora appendiculata]